ncbi:MAG: hypothetical protein F4X47_05545 [Gammaproteobacteria bacterium]|nr:hypothetical protein [Gammaproteobacteria bacterium]MYC51765.1 hypothetical protein [Gammaproteobacteria bacterium]
MRYVISYDLVNGTSEDYESLWDALRQAGAKRLLRSQWCLRRHNTTAVALRDHFWQYMESGDRLLVTCLDGSGWASMNLLYDPNKL